MEVAPELNLRTTRLTSISRTKRATRVSWMFHRIDRVEIAPLNL